MLRLCRLAQRREGGKRFFVMRLQYGTGLYTRSGHQLELRGLLPQQEGEARELGVLLGKQARLPVRLILVRVWRGGGTATTPTHPRGGPSAWA